MTSLHGHSPHPASSTAPPSPSPAKRSTVTATATVAVPLVAASVVQAQPSSRRHRSRRHHCVTSAMLGGSASAITAWGAGLPTRSRRQLRYSTSPCCSPLSSLIGVAPIRG
ncbi:hypothetical protein AAHA92_15961 [Salvia divinorum]|uniref:Uncharacterized protein n=1 Tax=Salvia divinorum TaxID=28513 RepID=A0ABD1GX93_SALDI